MLGCEERTPKQFVFVVRYALVLLMGSVETGASLVIRCLFLFLRDQKPWLRICCFLSMQHWQIARIWLWICGSPEIWSRHGAAPVGVRSTGLTTSQHRVSAQSLPCLWEGESQGKTKVAKLEISMTSLFDLLWYPSNIFKEKSSWYWILWAPKRILQIQRLNHGFDVFFCSASEWGQFHPPYCRNPIKMGPKIQHTSWKPQTL